MPGDTHDRMCACPHSCKIPSSSRESPVPTSLSTVQLLMLNSNCIVSTVTLVTVTFCFYNSTLFHFILNETFDMLGQKEARYFGYKNVGSHVKFQVIRSNRSCTQEHTCELPLLHQFLLVFCISFSFNLPVNV